MVYPPTRRVRALLDDFWWGFTHPGLAIRYALRPHN